MEILVCTNGHLNIETENNGNLPATRKQVWVAQPDTNGEILVYKCGCCDALLQEKLPRNLQLNFRFRKEGITDHYLRVKDSVEFRAEMHYYLS